MANIKKPAKVTANEIGGNAEHIRQMRDILDRLQDKDVYDYSKEGFIDDKKAIENIFKLTNGSKREDVLLRLTVIDSMYSTQMNRRYYALDELAEKLVHLHPSKELFTKFLKTYDANLFNGDGFNLWGEKYGIGKKGEEKGVAVSLISKYAYFETEFKFPIYDSIACEMYPRIWKYCGWKDKTPKLWVLNKEQQTDGEKTIVVFVKAIDELINRLGGNISYDHLDRLLWFTGKIYRGNLSLVVSRKDYEWCIKNWPEKDKEGNFDVTKNNLSKAPFYQSNTRLKAMFDLAKTLKTNN